MNDTLTHRGPDYSGTFSDGIVSMGHTLLAIREVTDISKQPYRDSPDWILLFNGQIYNNERLKKKLSKVDPLRENLDTYILYSCIEEFGWEFIRMIHGMFSIAVYNKTEGIVRLYRDGAGQKSLYYWHNESTGNLLWSSEIKGLIAAGAPKNIDENAVMVAASLGYIPGEMTLLGAIKKVRPGEIITFDLKSRRLTREYQYPCTKNYYSKPYESRSWLQDTFKDLLEEHLQSKSRVSINLSGGLDSSILLHEIRERGHDVDTYTTFFEMAGDNQGNFNDDAKLAKKLAAHYGTTHTEIIIKRDDYFEALPDAYACIEEPNYNISIPAYYLTAKYQGISGDNKRVVLKGDGGDEVFGGYSYYQHQVKTDMQIKLLGKLAFNILRNLRNSTNYNFDNYNERWIFHKNIGASYGLFNKSNFLIKYLAEASVDYLKKYKLRNDSTFHMMLLDRFFWLSDESFVASDKIYMSQSMEVRSPFSFQPFRDEVDSKLLKNTLINGHNGKNNKIELRKYAEGRLPDYITKRSEKTGWRAPVHNWYDAKAKDLYLDIIDTRIHRGRYIDWKSVKQRFLSSDGWPQKSSHLYLSLALVANRLGIDL